MRKRFDFQQQMGTGDAGEKDFQTYYPEFAPIKSKDDLKFDFTLNNGHKLELKTDTYRLDETPNFFMEYYSDSKNLKVGGPWRAYNDEIDLFVYYFVQDRTFFWFKTKELHQALENHLSLYNPKIKSVPNKGWITQGFAIPRDSLDKILLKKDTFK
jgi:hypothetical protein